MQHPIPLVAIVGRPNVGKSRLFNRYAGHSRALVEDTPGVTRDRIAEEIEVEGRRILLVDTAGLDSDAESDVPEDLSSAVQEQALSAVSDADAILFVVDGRSGLLPEDEAIARTLRRSQCPLAVAVNKLDSPGMEDRLGEFHRLGLDPVVAVSAEHGLGAFDALEQLVERIPAVEQELDPELAEGENGPLRIALVGRPNVGKSSLTNRLIGEQRVVVSSVPGTTRDAIDVRFSHAGEEYVLVDTAGLRRPGRRTRMAERGSALMTVRALERAQVALLLVDAEEGITDQDARVAKLVRERGCATVVVANKWDLVSGERGKELLEEIAHGLRFVSDCPTIGLSAKTGARVARLFPALRKVVRDSERRIPTAELNDWLQDTVKRHEPSMARRGSSRRPIKFFYGTQTGIRPPTFVLFCTEPDAIQESYRRFLENRLRESFGFKGSPVRLRLRARDKKGRGSRRS
jgi:GTP-binding protein